MANTIVQIVMAALEITDTDAHNSDNADCRTYDKESFYINNGLNQNVSCQLQASGDGGSSFDDIGSPVVVNTVEKGWIINSEAYPILRIEVKASASPTSGTITITANLKRQT